MIVKLALGLFLLGSGVAEERKKLFEAIAGFNSDTGAQAAARLAQIDSVPAAKALLQAYSAIYKRARPLQRKSAKWRKIIEKGSRGNRETYRKAQKEYKILAERLTYLQSISYSCGDALAKMKDGKVADLLLEKISQKRDPSLRVLACRALATSSKEGVLTALHLRLRKDKSAAVHVAAIDALAKRRALDQESLSLLCLSLGHRFWQVQVAAARSLAQLKSAETVLPLIEALKDSKDHVAKEMNNSLVAITGVDKHGASEVWREWWNRNREAFLAGRYKPEPGERARGGGGTTFYGIPVTSRRMIFLVDRSGSMNREAKWKPQDIPTGAPGADIPKPTDPRRIDVAKYELKKVLAMLPDKTEFNVIFWSGRIIKFSEKMVVLSKKTRKEAYAFIDSIETGGPTNVSQALNEGFEYAGPALTKKLLPAGIDTVYLLSDGMPTDGITEPSKIMEFVDATNRLQKVVIHTIAVEPSRRGARFMKRLAAGNFGSFVER